MGTRNRGHLCPTCAAQPGWGDLHCTLPGLGLGSPLQEVLGLRVMSGCHESPCETHCPRGATWWAAKHQPPACALSVRSA